MEVKVTVTLQWDATQFAAITSWLSRSKEDPAKVQQLTAELEASRAKLAEAMAAIQTL